MKYNFDIIILGGGILGQTMALAAAQTGLSTALIDRRDMDDVPSDGRAFALAATSMRMMMRLGLDVLPRAQPINDMLITEGDASSPWRIHFDSEDHGEPTAFMVESAALYEAVSVQVKDSNAITRLSNIDVTDWAFDSAAASVTLADGKTLSAPLMIAADGRNSHTRQAAGIEVQQTPYDQAALVTTISHALPHDGLALQRFLPGGPLAVLPLTDQRCQIVWSNKSAATNAAMTLPDAAFTALLSEQIGGHLGDIKLAAPRQSYPLALQMAERVTAERLALIGDAAHIIHPLAGQGLNLGLRDIAALAHCLTEAQSLGQDIGVAGLADYPRWRGVDTRMMGAATDSLSRLYQHPSRLLGHLRRAGMAAVNNSDLAKDFFMAEAAGEIGELPSLMQR